MTATTPISAENAPLRGCAADPSRSRGRGVDEAPSRTRNPFQRDRDRILHAAAFRRLESKTQVFVHHEGDRWRTRLTHTLEAAQIARTIARTLGLDADLAEAVALAHDLGHPPFGHAGEDALSAAMKDDGGFDHNEQSMRVLVMLERRYPTFDGLNLTWETLEGVLKHNGPVIGPRARKPDRPISAWLSSLCDALDLRPAGYASVEAQLAALADDIAYINHDVEDGFRAALYGVDDLRDAPLIGDAIRSVETDFASLDAEILVAESVRRLIGEMVEDLAAETARRAAAFGLNSADDARAADGPAAGFSQMMGERVDALRAFQFARMYRHFRVNRMTLKARNVIGDLFSAFEDHPDCLPPPYRAAAEVETGAARRRVVADYIASMTDRLALQEHSRMHDPRARAWEAA